jgi:hypothetical protein
MTQENKELLFKDLCARLPYGVVLQLTLWEEKTTDCRLTGIDEDGNLTADVPADCAFSIEGIKPYLRPMSSMTEEEKLMYEGLMIGTDNVSYMLDVIDWLNAHHFDYRDLIQMDLAIAVTKENNPYII